MTTPHLLLVEPPNSAFPIAEEMRETFRVLDVVASGWILVLSASTSAPPASPAQGDSYIVPEGATGVWEGHARHLTIATPVGWIFRVPRSGWIAVVADENAPYGRVLQYDGTQWTGWILPASAVSFSVTGTNFTSVTLQALMVEINARLIVNEGHISDHESRLVSLEAIASSSADLDFKTFVELLLGFNGTNAATATTDDSPAARTATFNGNAQLSTAQAKFGTASLKLDGTGDYITYPIRPWSSLANNRAMTIECFIRPDVVNKLMAIFAKRSSSVTSEYAAYVDSTGHLLVQAYNAGGVVVNTAAATPLVATTWYHIAVTKHDNVWRGFVNGALVITATETSDATGNTDTAFHIGRDPSNTGRDFQGYVDELRFTAGKCRYVAAFTAPTAAFPRS